MGKRALTHRDLDVYQRAFEAATGIFEASKSFPREETYALTDQIRRSSRSVCANLGKPGVNAVTEPPSSASSRIAKPKRPRPKSGWLEFAQKCQYIERDRALAYYNAFDRSLATIVGMITHPETWVLGDA